MRRTLFLLPCLVPLALACQSGSAVGEDSTSSVGTSADGSTDSGDAGTDTGSTDTGDSTTGVDTDPSPSEWMNMYMQLECELANVECDCAEPMPATYAECIADLENRFYLSVGEAESAGLVYDGACAAESIERLSQRGCDTAEEWFQSGYDCHVCTPLSVYHGEGAVGDACTNYGMFSDCALGLGCSYGFCFDPCIGEMPPILGEGDPCVDPETFLPIGKCGENLRCDYSIYTCVPAPAVGEACTNYCYGPAFCDDSDPMMPICAAYPADGEPCPAGECGYGAICLAQDQGDPICVAQPSVCI